MNIMIIPEDSRTDRYILEPLFRKIMFEIGKPHAKVRVCENPILQGVDQALRPDRIVEIVNSYKMVDLFILCVDRDADENRQHRLRNVEIAIPDHRILFAEHGWEEVEAWLIAGMDLPNGWSWNIIRSDRSVKEHYFEPLAAQLGFSDGPGGGRKQMGLMSCRNLERILARCPELKRLSDRIQAYIN